MRKGRGPPSMLTEKRTNKKQIIKPQPENHMRGKTNKRNKQALVQKQMTIK